MTHRVASRLGLALLTFTLLLVGHVLPALAWVEVHVAGDDVRLTVDKAGIARVEHKVTLKISGGPLGSFDIRGVDPDAVPEPDGYVIAQKAALQNSLASAMPISLELLAKTQQAHDEGTPDLATLRVQFEAGGLNRGVYVLLFRYRTDLQSRGAIQKEGVLTRLSWTGPLWEDGYDSARLIFELPPAPTEPRINELKTQDGSISAPVTLSTLRRLGDKDELELLRPYVPKAEQIRWSIHVDSRIFQSRQVEAPPQSKSALDIAKLWSSDHRRTLYFAAGAALFVLMSVLVVRKGYEVARMMHTVGAKPRPLVPLPLFLRAVGSGLLLVAGIALQLLLKTGTLGALLIALATAFAAYRTPRLQRGVKSLRRPGKWLPVGASEAFRQPPKPRGIYLDISTRAGKIIFTLLFMGFAAALYPLALVSTYHACLLAMDITAFLAIFCTGRLGELPPDPAATPVRFLRKLAKQLNRSIKNAEARVIGRIRIPDNSPDADEIRLGWVPRFPLRGFISIEVGVVYAPGAGGAIEMPEVLLRVAMASPCEQAISKLANLGHVGRGRKPDERVIAFTPRLPTVQMTAAIVAALGRIVMSQKGKEALNKPKKAPRKRLRKNKELSVAA